ncbi:MFS transporter [Actinomadura darangshiensis]|uniref:MFS transporter n=1 Tax=Actinomadura darangshiensis TaxID=705336 RepID=UPI001FB661A1|nr:MFS transporter [Actinomadura darangshiensis]
MPLPLLSLLLVVFSLTTGEFVIAGILPDVAGDLAVSVPAAGRLVTAYALGMIVGGPVVTALTARLPRKPLIAGLITVSILGNLGSAAAPDYPVLLAARFVAGLVVATFFAVAIATAVSMAEPGREASTIAKVALGLNLGIVLGTPIGTLIGQDLGWRATFASVAAITAVALPMVLRLVPARPGATGSVLGELRVFSGRDVRLAIVLTALGNVGVVTVFTYIAPLLTKLAGFGSGAVPVLLLVYGAGAVIGNFAGGRLSDRALMPSLIWLLTALAAALALFWAVSDVRALAAVLTFALGLLAFAIIPGMQARVLTSAGAAPTLAVAVNASGFQVAAAVAGWLGGALIAGPGLRAIFPAAALLTVAGLAVAVHIHRHDTRPAPAKV